MSENKIIVPVEAAQKIAEQYHKSQVVIISVDSESTATATFGVSPQDKIESARLGEFLARQMGGIPNQSQFSEDFRRDFNAANYKAARDLLRSAQAVFSAYPAVAPATQKAIETFLTDTNPSVPGQLADPAGQTANEAKLRKALEMIVGFSSREELEVLKPTLERMPVCENRDCGLLAVNALLETMS